MKLDTSIYHLVIFLASLASLTALILTGHDDSPLLHQITGGLLGGIIGGSGAGAAPLIGRFFSGPSTPPSAQSGYVRLPMLFLVIAISLAVTACACFGQAAKVNPVATACASSSVAIKSITVAKSAGTLTPQQIERVDKALAVVAPVCLAPSQPTADSATLLALTAATAALQDVAARDVPPTGASRP